MSEKYEKIESVESIVARQIAREEIASLCGMILRRLQDEGPTRSFERNMQVEVLTRLFGEALADFSGPSQPGE